jgi:hypothetical protein
VVNENRNPLFPLGCAAFKTYEQVREKLQLGEMNRHLAGKWILGKRGDVLL